MATLENRNRVLLNMGKAYWNGNVILDEISCTINIVPQTVTSKALGEITSSTRWAGVEYTVDMTEYKHTAHTRDYYKEYMNTGLAPEITIQGYSTDTNSDYYSDYGADTVTASGCIITSNIAALQIDASSNDHTKESITMSAKNLQYS